MPGGHLIPNFLMATYIELDIKCPLVYNLPCFTISKLFPCPVFLF